MAMITRTLATLYELALIRLHAIVRHYAGLRLARYTMAAYGTLAGAIDV